MAGKKNDNKSYNDLMASLKSGEIGKCYIFHGAEQYLLMNCLGRLRSMLCKDGLNSFNYKRIDISGKSAYMFEEASESFIRELAEATEMLPFGAERTLIEIHEYDIFKSIKKEQLSEIISDLPDFVCVVFVFTAIEYKPDGRLKITKEIEKHATVVDFTPAEESDLIRWIIRHFKALGKDISSADSKHLAELTGGLMSTLNFEIEKVASFAEESVIKRSDIDTVVIPVLDAVAYRLSDAIIKKDSSYAMLTLDKLLQMHEPAHRLIHNISLKMRQLLAARICIDNKIDKTAFMKMCGIRHEYPAQILLNTARMASTGQCKDYVLQCAQTAFELNNSNSDDDARIIELVVRLLGNNIETTAIKNFG